MTAYKLFCILAPRKLASESVQADDDAAGLDPKRRTVWFQPSSDVYALFNLRELGLDGVEALIRFEKRRWAVAWPNV